jgi:hypothetical protein
MMMGGNITASQIIPPKTNIVDIPPHYHHPARKQPFIHMLKYLHAT